MLKGAIFDMDGTLIDSMAMWRGLAERYVRSLGLEPRENVREKNQKRTFQGMVEELRSFYGLDKSQDQAAAEMRQVIADFYAHEVTVKEGVPAFLQALNDAGVRCCIATATDRDLAMIALERCGLLPYFSAMFCCSEVGAGKNRPDVFRCALAHLGTKKEETLVFEDALYAVRTAKADGFQVAGIYDSFEKEQEALRTLADFYLTDYLHVQTLGALK